MLCGPAFEQTVMPHGTTAVVTDPHEISNVAGTEGLEFMLETTKNLNLSVYFMLPSCVPATDLDESGAVFGSRTITAVLSKSTGFGTCRAYEFIRNNLRR